MSDYLACDCFICDCAETRVGGERQPIPRFHDCAYIRQRRALIPEAERRANAKVRIGPAEQDDAARGKWTQAFAAAMDELARPLLNGQR
jgi:hypothetical protein